MTLDLAKVSLQLRQMSRRLQQRREELLRRRELASGALQDLSDRWQELRDLAESRQRNQRLASPREPLAFRGRYRPFRPITGWLPPTARRSNQIATARPSTS